jgi:hypothetical protein
MNRVFARGKRQLVAITFIFTITSILLLPSQKAFTQEIPIPAITPQPEETEETAPDGLFFADIIVRGQPVFQVGSVSDVSASQRAQIVNRRRSGYFGTTSK